PMTTLRSRGRVAAALLAPALVLAACGDDDGDTVDDAADAPVEEAADDPADEPEAGEVTLTLAEKANRGGKSAAVAEWIEDWVILGFEAMRAEEDVNVTLVFEGSGADDEDYKTAIALDLSTVAGADVIGGFDGIWVGEFAQAGYIQPLNQIHPGAD